MTTPSPTTPREAGPASGDALRKSLGNEIFRALRQHLHIAPERSWDRGSAPMIWGWSEAISAIFAGPLAPVLAEFATLEARLAKMERERDEARASYGAQVQRAVDWLREHNQTPENAVALAWYESVRIACDERMVALKQEARAATATAEAAQAEIGRLIAAWESLPGGQRYHNSTIQAWLIGIMGPAFDAARAKTAKGAPSP